MKLLKLSNSEKFAIVSDEDFKAASKYSWFLKPSHWNDYVVASVRHEKKVKTLRLHRFIAERVLGDLFNSRFDVHHVNLNPLDNSRENLELASRKQHSAIHARTRG